MFKKGCFLLLAVFSITLMGCSETAYHRSNFKSEGTSYRGFVKGSAWIKLAPFNAVHAEGHFDLDIVGGKKQQGMMFVSSTPTGHITYYVKDKTLFYS